MASCACLLGEVLMMCPPCYSGNWRDRDISCTHKQNSTRIQPSNQRGPQLEKMGQQPTQTPILSQRYSHTLIRDTMQKSFRLIVRNAKQLVMVTKNHEKMLCGPAMNQIEIINNGYT